MQFCNCVLLHISVLDCLGLEINRIGSCLNISGFSSDKWKHSSLCFARLPFVHSYHMEQWIRWATFRVQVVENIVIISLVVLGFITYICNFQTLSAIFSTLVTNLSFLLEAKVWVNLLWLTVLYLTIYFFSLLLLFLTHYKQYII